MKYIIKKTNAAPSWESANPLEINNYPWYTRGDKQKTEVRALYNDSSLFLQFSCEDKHISAENTALNSPVSRDSCVEFFADPGSGSYFNVEVNCCGTLLAGYGPGRPNRKLIDAALAEKIKISRTMPGPVKQESPQDKNWLVEIDIPFSVIEEFTGFKIPRGPGNIWKANFYRCGGKTDPQFACWAPVTSPKPDYHRPECFGELVFE
ncbi:MAG: hypothetical protein A2297_00145 [Elusimicrobia bacterium RIFOXYB2_FULL_48_7]|nr:MAG: hypothetical protein A2297_00145 [Elusimicrobia bacterium RIFOXYB2_FULL_48_7]